MASRRSRLCVVPRLRSGLIRQSVLGRLSAPGVGARGGCADGAELTELTAAAD